MTVTSNDASGELLDSIKVHVAAKTPMRIQGGGSKSFLGQCTDEPAAPVLLSTTEHIGVTNYDPTELVMTARSGTPIQSIIDTLTESGQQLPFEPPCPVGATLGGTIACGLSGPSRPYSGSARDHVLGVRIINGKAETLRFGGEVMKNVAGYDVSRVQVGAYGTLGLVMDVSMKVLPLAETTVTLAFEQNQHDTKPMVALARTYLPITAAALIGKTRFIRLAGSEAGVQAAVKELGGESVDVAPWEGLRNWSHEFFNDPRPTWRVSVPDYTPILDLPDDPDGTPADVLYDWGGAQRWVKTAASAQQIFAVAERAQGHATRFSNASLGEATHQPITGVAARLQSELRTSFDPERLFNRSRFHAELDA